MDIAGFLLVAVQIGFAVHALEKGYPLFWVFLIIFVPLLGCLLYAVLVILPEVRSSRATLTASKVIKSASHPSRRLRELRDNLDADNTHEDAFGDRSTSSAPACTV